MALSIGGCTTTDSESKSYPKSWTALEHQSGRKCALPVGTFSNSPSLSHFEYPQDQNKQLLLSQVFASGLASKLPTHISFDRSINGDLGVLLLERMDDEEVQIAELTIQRKDIKCRHGRFSMVSKTTHETFNSYKDDQYDPLYTAAYLIGTFGMGAPISHWYEYHVVLNKDNALAVRRLRINSGLLFLIYTRTAMADDWFIYESVKPH